MFKIRKMVARPIESVDLAMPIAGFVRSRNPNLLELGADIPASKAFDRYSVIQTVPELKSNFSAVRGSTEIDNLLVQFTLLQGESSRQQATLAQAISEANQFYLDKITNVDTLQTIYKRFYVTSATNPQTIPSNGESIITKAQVRHDELLQRYNQLKLGIIESTENTTYQRGIRTVVPQHGSEHVNPYNHRTLVQYKYFTTYTHTQAWNGSKWADIQNTEPKTPVERVVTKTGELSNPKLDLAIDTYQIKLRAMEKLSEDLIFAEKVKNLKGIWVSQFEALLSSIVLAQKELVETYLISTIEGTVTAINKDEGEYFQPGESLIRVENPKQLLLVGMINAKEQVNVGDHFTLTCTDLFDSGTPHQVSVKVCSVRGHESDNDEWEVIFKADNSGLSIPLNYTFDAHNCDLARS